MHIDKGKRIRSSFETPILAVGPKICVCVKSEHKESEFGVFNKVKRLYWISRVDKLFVCIFTGNFRDVMIWYISIRFSIES